MGNYCTLLSSSPIAGNPGVDLAVGRVGQAHPTTSMTIEPLLLLEPLLILDMKERKEGL